MYGDLISQRIVGKMIKPVWEFVSVSEFYFLQMFVKAPMFWSKLQTESISQVRQKYLQDQEWPTEIRNNIDSVFSSEV